MLVGKERPKFTLESEKRRDNFLTFRKPVTYIVCGPTSFHFLRPAKWKNSKFHASHFVITSCHLGRFQIFVSHYGLYKLQIEMKTSTFYNNKAASSPGGWPGTCNSKGNRHMVTRWGRGSSVFFPSWYKKGSRERGGTCYKAVSLFSASQRQSEGQGRGAKG